MTTKQIDSKKDDKVDKKDDKIDDKIDKKDDKIDDKVDDKVDDKKDDKVAEPTDVKERSELGRKVKALSEGYEDVNAKLDAIIAFQSKPPVDEPEDNLDPDWVPTTKQEMDDYFDRKMAARDTARSTAEKGYNDAYMNTIGAYKEHEDYEEICAKLDKSFNVRHTSDGKADAKVNFLEAANAHYREKIHGKTNPLEKNKGEELPLGSGGDEEIVDKDDAVMPTLDKDAMAYIEATGKTAEEVVAIMKKPLPLGIGSIA